VYDPVRARFQRLGFYTATLPYARTERRAGDGVDRPIRCIPLFGRLSIEVQWFRNGD